LNFITFPRILNFIKLLYGYFLSRILRRPFQYGLPVAVSIEPTNHCNLHCPECPSGLKELSRAAGFMDLPMFHSIIDQLSPGLAWLTLYFEGEPFMNPRFIDFIFYARSKGIYVSSSTNGHFLNMENAEATVRSGLNRLIISIDGTDQQTYEAYRIGGSLKKVVEGINVLAEAKKSAGSKTPEIIIQFLVLRSNQQQIKDIRKKGIELGGNRVEIKTAQFYDFENGNPLMPDNGRFSRYQGNGQFKLKNILPGHCFRMWTGSVITWDGTVVPCCFDKDAKHWFGNIKDKSFREIWNSREYNDFRRMILNQRKTIEICRNCTEGMGLSRWF
jgi:radical SAM protein with 4Fe4S-binding SPASM domain